MFKFFSILVFFIMSLTTVKSQELNCTFSINADQIGISNKQVFQTLERALTELINQQQWTNRTYKSHEKIDCGMTLIISSYENNNFSGTLQVNAVRPVFGSNYKTPVFNFKDDAISFEYTEFEPLIFNPSIYQSNLISLMSYYAYMIIGIDADTFSLKGGEAFYQQALNIANLAQQGSYVGWEPKRNALNRYSFVDMVLSDAHKEYRNVMYAYHRLGMDLFSSDKIVAKNEIRSQLLSFEDLYRESQNSFLFRVFFDAKSDEVVEVFKSGPEVETKELKRLLNKISATNSSKWRKI